MSRKTAREVAMKLAFASLFGGEETYEDVLDKSGITEEPLEEDITYSEQVISGIEEHEAEIDDIIKELSIGWRIERMPRVDLCVLRVDIPCGVSINEAVELAKQFGGDRSSAYINGMLGTLAKRIDSAAEV